MGGTRTTSVTQRECEREGNNVYNSSSSPHPLWRMVLSSLIFQSFASSYFCQIDQIIQTALRPVPRALYSSTRTILYNNLYSLDPAISGLDLIRHGLPSRNKFQLIYTFYLASLNTTACIGFASNTKFSLCFNMSGFLDCRRLGPQLINHHKLGYHLRRCQVLDC